MRPIVRSWLVASALMMGLDDTRLSNRASAADAPAPPSSDPAAVKLLEDVEKAYCDARAYADQGEFVHALTIHGQPVKQGLPMHVKLVKPNKLDVDTGEVRVVSDGKTLTTVVGPFKKYTAIPSPALITLETFRDGPLGSVLFGGPAAPTSALVFGLMTDASAVKGIVDAGASIKAEPDREVGGKPLHSVLIDMTQGPDFRVLIDPATKLLHSVDWVIDPKALAADALAGESIAVDRIGWSAGSVSTATPGDDAFAFKVPTGFTKVEPFERPAGPEPKSPLMELVGKPVPDFTMTLLDGPGKTRTVTKADLAGKVVLIDFWATWCPPCLEELPEIQKLIDSLAKDGKDVLVIAQSVDQKPREVGELRTLVEQTLADKKVSLSGNKVGLIALDPSGTIGEIFHVEAIPALVLIDAKGVVQATHVGVQSEEAIRKEIDAVLEGKPIPAAKDPMP